MAESSAQALESLNNQTPQSETRNTEPKSVYATRNGGSTNVEINNSYAIRDYNKTPEMVTQSFNITLKIISPAASSGPFCRICHEGDTMEDLYSLCKCTGSVGLIHISCLERWLSSRRNTTNVDKCEICNYTFETIRYPKSLTEWYQCDQGPASARPSVLGDIACFSMITPLAAASTFLCIQGAKRHVLWSNSLEAGCLMAVATFLVTVYLVWNILTIRYHLRSYYKWRSINQNVRLVRYRRTSTAVQNDHVNLETNIQNVQPGPEILVNNAAVLPEHHHSLANENLINAETDLRSIL